MAARVVGMVPEMQFEDKPSIAILLIEPNNEGIVPFKLLFCNKSFVIEFRFPNQEGIVPENLLTSNLAIVNEIIPPTYGIFPVK